MSKDRENSKGITGLLENSEIQVIYCFNVCVLQLLLTCCSPHEHCADRTHLHPWTEPQGSQPCNRDIYSNNIYHRGMKTALWTTNLHLTPSPMWHWVNCGSFSVFKKRQWRNQNPWPCSSLLDLLKKPKQLRSATVVKEFTPELQCRNALDFLLQHKNLLFCTGIWITIIIIIIKYIKQTSIQQNKAES